MRMNNQPTPDLGVNQRLGDYDMIQLLGNYPNQCLGVYPQQELATDEQQALNEQELEIDDEQVDRS